MISNLVLKYVHNLIRLLDLRLLTGLYLKELTSLALSNLLTASRINSIERLIADLALIKL
jgi:hypothetical protein